METNPIKTIEKKETIFRTYQIVWYLVDVINVLLGLRVVLRMLGANPGNAFADFIYNLSAIFVTPFTSLFRNPVNGGSVIELTTIFAMIVYWLLAWGIVKILQVAKPVTPREVVEEVDSPEVRI